MKRLLFTLLTVFCLVPFAAQAADYAKQEEVRAMSRATLSKLYKEEPSAQAAIAQAAGYAVFASGGVNVIFVSAAYGGGVAHNNLTGQDTFMEMASGGVGLGLGLKDYRLVFVFHTPQAYKDFITQGWDFSGQADVAIKAGHAGDELSEASDVLKNVTVYQLTESGLMAQVSLSGTRYWQDDELNH